MERLIIFADYGLDDAAATATILRHERRFSHIDIVPIGGNVPPAVALRNCYTLLSCYPECLNKITVVDTTDLPQPSEYLAEIHGQDGMGDLFRPPETPIAVETLTFNEWLDTTDGSELVLSLGPMTMVKPLMERHSTYQPVIMGGCVDSEPNFKGYEFNHCLDREAFAFCTKQKHAAITLDTCRTEKLDMRKVTIEGDDVHSQVLRADQRLSVQRGEEGCYVWDDVAAVYLLHPERFTLKQQTDRDGNRIFNAVYVSDKLYFED